MIRLTLERLWDFFEGQPGENRRIRHIFLSGAVISSATILWAMFYTWITLGIDFGQDKSIAYRAVMDGAFQRCVTAPITEEIAFRLIPFLLIFKRSDISGFEDDGSSKKTKAELMASLIIWGMILSFFFFGIIHGSMWNIFVQGILGLALWFQFIYFSKVGKNPLTGLVAAIFTHSLYNFILLAIILSVLFTSS